MFRVQVCLGFGLSERKTKFLNFIRFPQFSQFFLIVPHFSSIILNFTQFCFFFFFFFFSTSCKEISSPGPFRVLLLFFFSSSSLLLLFFPQKEHPELLRQDRMETVETRRTAKNATSFLLRRIPGHQQKFSTIEGSRGTVRGSRWWRFFLSGLKR